MNNIEYTKEHLAIERQVHTQDYFPIITHNNHTIISQQQNTTAGNKIENLRNAKKKSRLLVSRLISSTNVVWYPS